MQVGSLSDLLPTATIVWLSALMPHDNDSGAGLKASVHNRVRKEPHRKYPTAVRDGRAKARMLDQKIDDTLELL